IRRDLRRGFEKGGQQFTAMQDAAAVMETAKGITMTFDVSDAQDLKMTASIVCANSSDAGKIKAGVEEAWGNIKGAINLGMMGGLFGGGMGPQGPPIPPTLLRDLGSM